MQAAVRQLFFGWAGQFGVPLTLVVVAFGWLWWRISQTHLACCDLLEALCGWLCVGGDLQTLQSNDCESAVGDVL